MIIMCGAGEEDRTMHVCRCPAIKRHKKWPQAPFYEIYRAAK